MKIYNFDEITKEYLYESEACIDIEATRQAKKNIYYLPAYSTDTKPPKTLKLEVAIYNNGWQIVPDYRGCWIVSSGMEPIKCDKLGELDNGFIYITDAQYKKIINDRDYYIIENGTLVENPNYSEIKYAQNIDKLVQEVYELKSAKAYNGVIINDDLIFETNQISITNTVASLALMEDTTNWKFYNTYGLPVTVLLTKEQLAGIAKFGQNMINEAFTVEGQANEVLKSATKEQVNDAQWRNDFIVSVKANMDKVNNKMKVEL